jgi:hypothetical protein
VGIIESLIGASIGSGCFQGKTFSEIFVFYYNLVISVEKHKKFTEEIYPYFLKD